MIIIYKILFTHFQKNKINNNVTEIGMPFIINNTTLTTRIKANNNNNFTMTTIQPTLRYVRGSEKTGKGRSRTIIIIQRSEKPLL